MEVPKNKVRHSSQAERSKIKEELEKWKAEKKKQHEVEMDTKMEVNARIKEVTKRKQEEKRKMLKEQVMQYSF